MALFPSLSIGADALIAQQRALDVTGNNIANVNTPGYSRQTAVLSAIQPATGNIGGGVLATSVQQAIDPFLEARRLSVASDLAGANTQSGILDQVQSLFPVQGTNIASAMQDFFASANALANSPQDIPTRTDLLSKAGAVATQFNQTSSDIATLQRQTDGQIQQAAKDANTQLATIAKLNAAISAAQVSGTSPNDLLDQRRVALGTLAGILNIQVVQHDNGMVDVTSSSGQALVLGTQASTLATSLDPSNIGLDGNALSQIGVLTAGGSLVKLSGNVGGSVGSLLNLRDTSLPATSGQLDQLANTFRDAVNTVQTDPAGEDLNGAVGTPFFSGTGAAGLTLALTDPRTIAAARSSNLGDNTGALALAQVANTTFPALGGATLNDYFGTLQGQVGSAASAADSEATVQQNLSSNLEAQRDSVSGVNLEEEFTNLVQFQRGYQAAADLISVSNQMLDDLLSLVS